MAWRPTQQRHAVPRWRDIVDGLHKVSDVYIRFICFDMHVDQVQHHGPSPASMLVSDMSLAVSRAMRSGPPFVACSLSRLPNKEELLLRISHQRWSYS